MSVHTDRSRIREFMLRLGALCVFSLAMQLPVSLALAQYVYDPNAADEQEPGIRYFGSAKDDRGALMPGVTILLDNKQFSFVFVTDEQGRFRANLPLGTVPESVSPKCSKPGFSLVQVTKRSGPAGVKPTVQVNCVLRSNAAK